MYSMIYLSSRVSGAICCAPKSTQSLTRYFDITNERVERFLVVCDNIGRQYAPYRQIIVLERIRHLGGSTSSRIQKICARKLDRDRLDVISRDTIRS